MSVLVLMNSVNTQEVNRNSCLTTVASWTATLNLFTSFTSIFLLYFRPKIKTINFPNTLYSSCSKKQVSIPLIIIQLPPTGYQILTSPFASCNSRLNSDSLSLVITFVWFIVPPAVLIPPFFDSLPLGIEQLYLWRLKHECSRGTYPSP